MNTNMTHEVPYFHLPVGNLGVQKPSVSRDFSAKFTDLIDVHNNAITTAKEFSGETVGAIQESTPKADTDARQTTLQQSEIIFKNTLAFVPPLRDHLPQINLPLLHGKCSQNHEYYSKDADYHGTHEFAFSKNQRLFLLKRSEEQNKLKSANALSVSPRTVTAFSDNFATDAPDGLDSKLEKEYVEEMRLSKMAGSSKQYATRSYAESETSRASSLQAAMSASLDAQLARARRRMSAVEDAHSGDNAETRLSEEFFVLHTRDDGTVMAPTSFELRRAQLRDAPPIRSVRSIAERRRVNETVLTSTRRIIQPYFSADKDEPSSEVSRRNEQRRKGTEGLSDVDKWKIKMGLVSPTSSPTYSVNK